MSLEDVHNKDLEGLCDTLGGTIEESRNRGYSTDVCRVGEKELTFDRHGDDEHHLVVRGPEVTGRIDVERRLRGYVYEEEASLRAEDASLSF